MTPHTVTAQDTPAHLPWKLHEASGPQSRLHQVITAAQAQDRCALGMYLPVGYPNRVAGMDALHLLAQSADVIELGIPYADGVLDGPVIQQASQTALDAGFRIEDLFAAARELSSSSPAALVTMSYWQPLHAYGPLRFATAAAAAGIDAVLIPDLPIEEAAPWTAAARAAGLGTIPLVSHRTQPDRLARTVAAATGMLYAAATDGVTGNPQPVSPRLPGLITQLRSLTSLPIAAGIGISTPAQARTAAAWADVVVVGSAVIRRMQASPRAQTAAAAAAGRDFAAALHPRTHHTTREATR
ncbi:tryptophan synthase subunit alpha [Streptomyces sp. NBC_01571]|uniref:tryptophan synthase subunit alpha n=1 Tax=Streptomyces sp. NBC_01571 TaxID=2975883 RepID=UPI00224EDE9F|nr:tryptophan synthase subunit alpha [Streptomyces sp. NBC_01571]MCX4580992.1 tryptophan synthase subunit alpha [Streptomyces sp. NBC_01571]